MLQSFFISAFELLHGSQDNVAFRDSVYGPAGFCIVVISVAAVLFFYYFLNSVWARFSRTWPHWANAAILCVLLNCLCAIVIVWKIPSLSLGSPASLMFLFIDCLYAFLAFLIVSAFAKWWSPNARRTPF